MEEPRNIVDVQRNTAIDTAHSRPTPWAAYAAAVWAFAFALMSFYWAAGGRRGAHTVAAKPEELASSSELWAIGVAKLIPALLALALAWPGGRVVRRRLLLVAAWGVGILSLVYGVAGWIDHGLMAAGAIDTPELLGHDAVRWHLGIWDPWWVLGGVLFVAAARQYRASHQKRA